jgi:hypothetical protein
VDDFDHAVCDPHGLELDPMDLNDALHSCRCGAFIRDEGGTMKPGWKLKFVPGNTTMSRPKHLQDGKFVYINPKGEEAHTLVFNDAHRASWQWRTVSSEYPTEKDMTNVRPL